MSTNKISLKKTTVSVKFIGIVELHLIPPSKIMEKLCSNHPSLVKRICIMETQNRNQTDLALFFS